MKKKYFYLAVSLVAIVVILTVIFTGCVNNASTEYDVVKRTKAENFELLNESALKEQVVIIGDSIIELYPTYELFYGEEKVVYNRGISGDTSDRMLERLYKNALNISPDTVLILIGTNDIARGISHETIVNNISKSIDKCKESGVRNIIISSLFPVNKSIDPKMVGARTNKEILELNGKIKSLTQQKGVMYSDMTTALSDDAGNFNKEYTYDGLHPNAKGYKVIKEAQYPLIFNNRG